MFNNDPIRFAGPAALAKGLPAVYYTALHTTLTLLRCLTAYLHDSATFDIATSAYQPTYVTAW
jgi:hypothetical protein